MENVNENQVDSTQEASSSEERKQDQVSYDSFRKAVESEKRAKERARELESKLEAKMQAELEAQGKHEDIIQSLKSKLQETEGTLKKERESYLWNNVTSAVKTEAAKHGCKNPEKLVKLLDKEDFSMLQAENGQIMGQSLSALIDKAKKENDFLFTSPAVKVNDATPSSRVEKPKEKTPSEMTQAERLEAMKKNFGTLFNK